MTTRQIQTIILDWAGTTVDFGSRAPVAALERVFAAYGIQLSSSEARKDMGLLKRDHIRSILQQPRIRKAWAELNGAAPGEQEAELLFREFLPIQSGVLDEFSDVIPGVVETVSTWRSYGLRIGATTGYTKALMEIVTLHAGKQGYAPDVSVTPDMVGCGRPAPLMVYRNAIETGTYPLWRFVKIGDTPVDMQEGRNAGTWTIGITRTGNEVGLSESEWAALGADAQEQRLLQADRVLREAGACYTAPSVAECTPILEEIGERLAAGERP